MDFRKLDFRKLEENIWDVIKEEQIKLGYQREVIRLYYPLSSLNRFLEADLDIEEMTKALEAFSSEAQDRFGKTEISNKGERFCLRVAPEASEYIHTHTERTGFLYDFIGKVSQHGVTIEQVLQVFYQYSDRVHIEKVSHGEFDYLVYFEDGRPDSYRYCLTDEGCHVIYHRYTPEDYEELGL